MPQPVFNYPDTHGLSKNEKLEAEINTTAERLEQSADVNRSGCKGGVSRSLVYSIVNELINTRSELAKKESENAKLKRALKTMY